jgi:WD40 repeat protein
MLALYRSGRQAEALATYQAARRSLVDELGIEPSSSLRELEGRILRHDPSLDASAPPLEAAGDDSPAVDLRNPYKGLRAFSEGDADDFFGREALTAEIVARLETSRFLAVVGPSGSGKSSVVHAGVLPALRRGALDGSADWHVITLTPGMYPLEELEAALLRIAVNPPASLIEQLERDERGLRRAVRRILPPDGGELLLVLDQLEEVFTLVTDESERGHFLGLLERAVGDPQSRLRVVATMRADFYDRPLLYRGFAELLRDRVATVTPLSPEELERAVAGPAGLAGVTLEPGLLAQIVADVLDQPGALPLLQYALTELFEMREGRVLTRRAYDALGGVAGALARRAEELYADLEPNAQEATRQLFLRLVTLGEAADTRRRIERSELASLDVDQPALDTAIERFGGSTRLLSFDRDARTGAPTLEIAHEALLGQWGRLRDWIDEAREDIHAHRQLVAAALEWDESGRDASFLLRGSRLARVEAWAGESRLAQTELERSYLAASLEARAAAESTEAHRRARELALERRSVNRLRGIVAVFAAAALVAGGLTVFAFGQSNRSRRETRVATARELASAAVANLDVDPELSILLARQAVLAASRNGAPLPEAVDALHQAIAASRETLTIRTPASTATAFSPDGARVASAGPDGTDAYVWDSRTGKRLLTLRGERAPIRSIDYNPDGTRLVTASDDGNATVWDARTGRMLFTLADRGSSGAAPAVSFAPTGAELATADSAGQIRLWDLRRRRVRLLIPTHLLLCGLAWSGDAARIATGECGGTFTPGARIWDARSGKLVLSTVRPHQNEGPVFAVAFSPDDRRLAAAHAGSTEIWDIGGKALVATARGSFTGEVLTVAFDPDGRSVATSGTDGTARLWSAATGDQLLVLHGHTAEVGSLRFSPDGRRLVTGSEDGTVRVWDVTPGGARDLLTLDVSTNGVESVLFGPGDATVLTTGGIPGRRNRVVRSRLWNARTGAMLRSDDLETDEGVPAGFDAAGRVHTFIATASSPDGSVAAAASTDDTATSTGSVKLYDATTQRLLRTLPGRHRGVQSMEFSADGTLLATGNWDGTAVVWQVASGRPVRTFAAHNGLVEAVAFDPTQGLLATAGDDATAKLWDLRTGKRILTLHGHTQGLTDIAFSGSGKRLATASADGTVRVYVLPIGELMTISRSRLTRGWTADECRQYLPGGRCPAEP